MPREPGDLGGASSSSLGDTQLREGRSRNPQSQATEESDEGIVSKKAAKTWVTPVELLEKRPEADEEIRLAKHIPDADPDWCAHAPERIGQRAREQRQEKLTNLLSHMKVPLLKEAYQRLRKKAAPGIDGETWETYGEDLDVRLRDLEGRVHRGSYHPQPVRRTYIPKADGSRRPLGIPALEDKIVPERGVPTGTAEDARRKT